MEQLCKSLIEFIKILRFLVDNPTKCSVSGSCGPDPRQIFIFKLKLTNLLPEKMWVREGGADLVLGLKSNMIFPKFC